MKIMKKAVVGIAFLGLVAMPVAAMATDSSTTPATTGNAANTANYDTGVVYQNSTANITSNTQSLSIATDPQQGFSLNASGHSNSGTVYNDSTSGGGVFGALGGYTKSSSDVSGTNSTSSHGGGGYSQSSQGGGGFIDNGWWGDKSWGGGGHSESSQGGGGFSKSNTTNYDFSNSNFLGGFIAGGYYATNQNGFGDTWSSFSDHICITGSLNAIYSNAWENDIINTQMAATMGSANLASATAATAVAGGNSVAGSLDLAQQSVKQGGGGSFSVGGTGYGYYASGGGGSKYQGSTFSGSIAGQTN